MSNTNQNKVKKRRWVKLRKDSVINQTIINELETFLSVTSPGNMSKSLNHVFYMYHYYEKDHPSNFNHIAEDFHLLQEFFSGISTTEIIKEEELL